MRVSVKVRDKNNWIRIKTKKMKNTNLTAGKIKVFSWNWTHLPNIDLWKEEGGEGGEGKNIQGYGY